MHIRAHDHAEQADRADRAEQRGSQDDARDRPAARRTAVSAGLALLLAVVVALTAPAAMAQVRPLVNGDVPDPSIAQTKAKRYVVVGTGQQVLRLSSNNGRRWRLASPALLTRPTWARPRGSIWASDIVQLRGRWVLYYAAPVRGMSSSGRCIGVAVARYPTGRFRPVGTAPLVCPPDADAPRAADPVLDPGRSEPTLPMHGAIDPSLFRAPSGNWLLYKTDGRPSSIRIVPLTRDGIRVAGGSRQLLASGNVVENPVMLKRGRFFYLFMSVGDYTTCGYKTVYRRSANLLSWTGARSRPILSKPKTHLCGPGGADVLVQGRGAKAKVSLYFHGWVCRGTGRPCREPFHAWAGREDYRSPVRALYGTRLRFTKRKLAVRDSWIRRHR
jgi:arabinan endo-1,5-alpha-L-arabinosidase